ncbi:MAG TPA: hypothetical protein VEK35_09670 [Roseiarcus sp.]|nr:hypothetical protein [Roseiarcus sp.]
MVSDRALDLAISQQIITEEQANRLRALDATDSEADPERLRFVSGFGDLFVALGVGLFLLPAGLIANRLASPLVAWLTVAALAWLLAEFFTRRRRVALPSIVLIIVFMGSSFAAASLVFGAAVAGAWPWLNIGEHPGSILAAALTTVALGALHYLRFRVPITVAAGAAALCFAVAAGARLEFPDLPASAFRALIFACGVAVFLLAMRFDMSDLTRETRRTDIAFWLHLLAAPLIVHPLIGTIATGGASLDAGRAVVTLLAFLGLGALAVLIDRRALLVSGLAYAGFAMLALIRQTSLTDLQAPITVLALGAFVLAISAFWRPLRGVLLRRLPPWLAERVPHPLVVST